MISMVRQYNLSFSQGDEEGAYELENSHVINVAVVVVLTLR